ncbi:MAG: hypothetical protein HYU47_05635 [Deltaproteobacteria bacterium]|nr:hypothetical protein [Deltaproteobacteria bacterium]
MAGTAIDIHHHYVPPSLLQEARRHGTALGVEATESKNGETTVSFSGGPKFTLNPDLSELERRFAIMEKGKIAIGALIAHTASLGYRLDGERGEQWCRLYNEGSHELVRSHPDRFVALGSVFAAVISAPT